ncbi:LpqB family beta-propeller domain-containing protein, partial [Actinomyces sp. MRS3W]|uniref:LpqB family beta-propeller domain-containing protein n=1 Tax=Actinomyces sp. MRS3W TaxID=2800796 RepID=UPI0028FD3691
AWLAAGVVTAIPEGVTVGEDGVVVEEGTANVDLSDAAAALDELDDAETSLLVAQIRATLVGVQTEPGLTLVEDVRVRADGKDLGGPASLPAVDAAGGAVVGMCAGGVVQGLSSTRTTLVTAETLGAEEAGHPTLGADGVVYALSNSSLLRVRPDDSAASVILSVGEADAEDDGLLAPLADRHHWVWTAAAGTLLAVNDLGQRADIDAPWLAGREVVAFDLSIESARIVVRHRADGSGDNERVDVAAVVRDDGAPTALGEPREVPEASGARTTDIVWYDPVSVAMLPAVADGETTPRIRSIGVGGPQTTENTCPAATAMTADRASGVVQLTDSAGRVWQRSGATWRVAATDVSDVSFPLA